MENIRNAVTGQKRGRLTGDWRDTQFSQFHKNNNTFVRYS